MKLCWQCIALKLNRALDGVQRSACGAVETCWQKPQLLGWFMAYIVLHKKKLLENYRAVLSMLRGKIPLNVVTKFCLSNPDIIRVLSAGNEGRLVVSDSNMENFSRLEPALARQLVKCVIKTRLSDIQKIPRLPDYARPDRLYVSDDRMFAALAELPADMCPQIVLIAETGDMKDGIALRQLPLLAEKWGQLDIIGVSANFACLSGILPDEAAVRELAAAAGAVRAVRNLDRPFLSVGGTVACPLAASGVLDGLVQEIRMGEGIFFGYDSSGGRALPGLHRDVIELAGEILELAEKDFSIQQGRCTGFTATGGEAGSRQQAPRAGRRLRAVLDFGILAARTENLVPLDRDVLFAGQTFDFTVVDVTGSAASYEAGAFMRFVTDYSSASFCMMNRYICCTVSEED